VKPTPAQTVGPYLSIGLTWEDGPVADQDGVQVFGRLLDGAGEPVTDGMVEAWCAEPRAFARCLTDDEGRWWVRMPEAPAYDLAVFARGLLHRLITRVRLADTPREGGGHRFDIRLQGEGETPFFDV
jgi:protocatechuate 3,4-dioxygenase alpha subunit